MPITLTKRKFTPSTSYSEEYDPATGVCSIEYFMSSKDEWRVAPGDRIPIPWPYTTMPCSTEAEEIFENLRSQIRSILTEHEIRSDSEILERITRQGYCSTREILIISARGDSTRTWKSAATDIQELLDKTIRKRNTDLKIGVEIQSRQRRNWDTSAAVKSKEESDACIAVDETVFNIVKAILPNVWTEISYKMRGPRYHEKTKATIMISVLPAAKHMWPFAEARIEEAIKEVAANSPLNIQLAIEIVASNPYLLAFGDPAPAMPQSELPNFPKNGSSVGPHFDGSKDAGSLGAFVYFTPRNSEAKQKCFLTCYHVIASSDPENMNTNNIEGIGLFGRAVHKQISVAYPSLYDASATKKYHQIKVADGNDTTGRSAKVLGIMKNIEASPPFGKVIYASGRERFTDENRRLDWALVEFNSAETPQNLPLSLTKKQLNNGFVTYEQPKDGEVVASIGSPFKGTLACKIGRTTDITSGEIVKLKAHVLWKNERIEKDTHEYEINSMDDSEAFAERGDSGSMVLNAEKEWIGMIFGALQFEGKGYFTSAQDIIDDIKKTTGGTITLM